MFVLNDELAAELNVEKIKTLGDCYVAATGVLTPMPDHAAQMIWMGLGMHKVRRRHNTRRRREGEEMKKRWRRDGDEEEEKGGT